MNTLPRFDNFQRLLLNGAFENELISAMPKERLLSTLEFGRMGCGEPELFSAYDDMIRKVQRLSEEEWECLKRQVPLFVDFDERAMDELEPDQYAPTSNQ